MNALREKRAKMPIGRSEHLNQTYLAFRNPGAAYRAKPFWAWNGRLTADEIRRQIEVFQEMGFGGYFMHSRVGLQTRYLGEEWFDAIRVGVDEGRKRGMEAWLYDEDRWPSGLAGGLVTRDPRWRQKRLNCLRAQADQVPADALAVFRFEIGDDGALIHYERIELDVAEPDEVLLAFQVVERLSDTFFNGYTYLDTLSKDAVKAFIDVTHESYARQFGEELAHAVPGVFTDEPNRGHFLGKWKEGENDYQVPWTDRFLEEFHARMGYDLAGRLPEVFFNRVGARYSKTRADTAECVNQLFVEAFAQQVGRWCGERGLILTGHVLQENTLGAQLATSGSQLRFYEHMQAPGMDILNHQVAWIVPKQAQSVARQCGREWTLSEMYANHGWDYPLRGFKSYGDWQAVLGVNLRCPHLAWYTMAGERKRDCPPTISFQEPWWREYRLVEDHFARVAVAMTQGEPACDLLCVHPGESVAGMAKPGWAKGLAAVSPDIRELDRAFERLSRVLLGLQVDFDYGDEEMLDRLGRVEQTDDGPVIALGEMRYRRMLVPTMPNIRRSTLDLLAAFAEAGGEVACFGAAPTHMDWEASPLPGALAASEGSQLLNEEAVVAHYQRARTVSVHCEDGTDATNILAQLRRSDEATWLFLVNTDTDHALDPARVRVGADGQTQEWDTTTGERVAVPSRAVKGATEFETSFPPGGSRLFVVASQADASLPAQRVETEIERITLNDTEFAVQLDEPNVVVFDCPEHRIDQDDWAPARHILEIDALLRDRLGLERRSNRMIQPWFREAFLEQEDDTRPSLPLSLRHTFDARRLPQKEIEIALEQPERWRVSVNGHALELSDGAGWWVDPCLRRFRIPTSLLKTGKNEILMETTFDAESDLEFVFLLGDFSVWIEDSPAGRVAINKPVRRLALGDWTRQGLPFYAGSVRYEQSFQTCANDDDVCHCLVVPAFAGSCLRVYANDEKLGAIVWEPFEMRLPRGLDLTAMSIEVVGHRANANGLARDPQTGARRLIPIGLMESSHLSVRERKLQVEEPSK